MPARSLSSAPANDSIALPQRVLFWTENYQVGGCDRFLADLIHGAQELGWDCVTAGNPNPAMDSYLKSQGITKPRITIPIRSTYLCATHPVANLVKSHLRPRNKIPHPVGSPTSSTESRAKLSVIASRALLQVGESLIRWLTLPGNYRALRRLVTDTKPSVVVINNGGYPAGESCRAMAIAAHRAGVPRIIHVVHNIPRSPSWPQRAETAYDRHLSEITEAWVTASEFTSQELSRIRGIPANKVHTIRHGLKPHAPISRDEKRAARSKLLIDEAAYVITIIALFDTRKGHETLINALNTLKTRTDISRWKVLLVGDGETRTHIEELVDHTSLKETVTFLGWRDDIGSILIASDVLALPSVGDECLPYAVFHAMEYGLPVVASRIAGIPEQVLDGETGILITPGSEAELVSALVALQDPDLRVRMGTSGRARLVERFDPSLMIRQMTDLWTDPFTHVSK